MSSALPFLSSLPVATASLSLGRAWVHELDVKMAEAGKAGFKGVELFWEDLVYAAKRFDPVSTETSEVAILQAAKWTRGLCDAQGIEIFVLQPFMNYDGLIDEGAHKKHIEKLRLWFKVAKVLGTQIFQVPTNMIAEGSTGDQAKIVADLKEIGELGLKENPPIRFAYEALAWGAHNDLWQQVWKIIELVDLPNVGTVLDTYQLVGRVYGDPTSPDGKQPNAAADLAASLRELAATPKLLDKLFYIQLSDAEFISPPLSPSHPYYDASMKPHMQWSRNARLFPCEGDMGGYLPVLDFCKVIFGEVGYRGWVSMESFSRTMSDPDPSVPRSHAQRGMNSWKAVMKAMESEGIH